jgi:hypothetical protein
MVLQLMAELPHQTFAMAGNMTGGEQKRTQTSFYAYMKSEPMTVRTMLRYTGTNL